MFVPRMLCIVLVTVPLASAFGQQADPLDPVPLVEAKKETNAQSIKSETGEFVISGTVVDGTDKETLGNVRLRLYVTHGTWSEPREVASALSDLQGRFDFAGLAPPRMSRGPHSVSYYVFATLEGRPAIAVSELTSRLSRGFRSSEPGARTELTVELPHDAGVLTGRVTDPMGRPLQGARIYQTAYDVPQIAGFHDATTDADGRYAISDLPEYSDPKAKWTVEVEHADFPRARAQARSVSGSLDFRMVAGCIVTGRVVDQQTSKPAAGAIVIAQLVKDMDDRQCTTKPDGSFRMALPDGNYHFLADFPDRVAAAIEDQECLAGRSLELPDIQLTRGGEIAGRMLDGRTGQPLTRTEEGNAVTIGVIGPSRPKRRVISPESMALVDDMGVFRLRVPAGEYFPYVTNVRSDRMAWDTHRKPAVTVTEGGTTEIVIKSTVKQTPDEKMRAARVVADSLPQPQTERVKAILAEFRKLNHTVDETETWCLLMKELVDIGKPAVPIVCAELDETTESNMLRRLAFALRALGDPRAVPSLIRAVPRTLLPSASDYGLIVENKELHTFMCSHDLEPGAGMHFSLGRPMREVVGSLKKLTGHEIDWLDFNSVHRSDDPRRQRLQRGIFVKHALAWQAWWDEHAKEFVKDEAYQNVRLVKAPEEALLASAKLGTASRLGGGSSGTVLSTADVKGKYAAHFLDFDTGRGPRWPENIPRTEAGLASTEFREWLKENGVDLMCVVHRPPNAEPQTVLRAINMTVLEINQQDADNLEKRLKSGVVPEGRPVGELLIPAEPLDPEDERIKPAFLYTTSEGNHGLIRITDLIKEARNITGQFSAPRGVGFFTGVKIDHSEIIP